MKKNMRRCPYCGSRVSYIKSLTELGSGEHLCPECNKYSNIEYSKKIYLPAAIILVLALVLAAIFLKELKTHLILAFVGIIIPFGVFFFMIPLFYMLNIIPSEAKTPVKKVEPDKKSKTKERKVTETKNIKEQEKTAPQKENVSVSSIPKDKTYKSKFQKFVHTYIIVDDDDENENKRQTTETYSKKNTEILHVIEPEIENIAADDDEEIDIDLDIEFEDISSSTGNNESKHLPKAEPLEEIKPADVSIKTKSAPEHDTTETKSEEKTEKTTDEKPVFHKLTKSKDIDYHYLPEYGESIIVDTSFEEEIENEDDKEDEEVLNFFEAAPTEQEELEFGKKKYDEQNDDTEYEETEALKEEQETEYEPQDDTDEYETDVDDRKSDYNFEYLPDTGDNIILRFEVEKEIDKPQTKEFAEEEIEDLFSEIENDSYKKALEKSFAKKKENETDENVFSYEDEAESIFSLNNSDDSETIIENTQVDEDIDLSNVITYGEEFDSIFGIDDIAIFSNDYLASKESLFTNIRPYNENEEESENEEINEPLFEEENEEVSEPLFEEEENEEINEPLFEEEENEEISEPLFEEEENEEISEPLFEEEENEEINESLFEEDEYEEESEYVEGAIEYVPETKELEKTKKFEPVKETEKISESFKVSYEDNTEAQNVMPIDLSGYQTKYYTEENTDKKTKDNKSETVKKVPAPSKYEKKFPRAAKAAADMEKKQAKDKTLDKTEEKAAKSDDTSNKQAPSADKKKKKKKSKGFFATLKQKISDATLEERNQLFEEEEKAEKLAEKEARRKAKELAKERAEKAKEQEQKQAKKQDTAPKVKKSGDSVSEKEYAVQENIVLESVREKAENMTEKKLSQKEKAQIISKKNIEEKQKREIEKRKMELEKSRAEYEKKSLENQKHREQSEKAEQVRQNQMKKAQLSQAQIKNNTNKRNRSDMKLKGGKNVRSVVSQNNAKKSEHIKNNFTDDE